MNDVDRGKVRNWNYVNQQRDWSGLRFENITPTDLDCLIEYKNLGYIFMEIKYGDAKLPFGQALALRRLCDDLQEKKPTMLIVATHNSESVIDVANCGVREFYYNRKWYTEKEPSTTKHLVENYFDIIRSLR